MSSSDQKPRFPARRRVIAGLAALILPPAIAGCGFRPLYGRHGTDSPTVHEALSTVSVGIIPNREGQILRNALISRLNPSGRPRDPRYRLTVGLREDREGIGLTAIDTITRTNLILRADYTLTEISGDVAVARNHVTAIAGFEVLADEVANLSSEIDARRRALTQLADDIRTQLAITLSDQTSA